MWKNPAPDKIQLSLWDSEHRAPQTDAQNQLPNLDRSSAAWIVGMKNKCYLLDVKLSYEMWCIQISKYSLSRWSWVEKTIPSRSNFVSHITENSYRRSYQACQVANFAKSVSEHQCLVTNSCYERLKSEHKVYFKSMQENCSHPISVTEYITQM
jgi:hypothetical protein